MNKSCRAIPWRMGSPYRVTPITRGVKEDEFLGTFCFVYVGINPGLVEEFEFGWRNVRFTLDIENMIY